MPPVRSRSHRSLLRPRRLCSVLPNCTAKPKGDKRLYIADELDDCHDISALTIRRPVEKATAHLALAPQRLPSRLPLPQRRV